MTVESRLEELEKQGADLKMTTSHTKRTSVENGKKIDRNAKESRENNKEIVSKMGEINHQFGLIVADLTGEKGYFKQIDKNTRDGEARDLKIERNTFNLNKQDIRTLKLVGFVLGVGLVIGWWMKEIRYQQEQQKKNKKETILYHKPFNYGLKTKVL